MTEEFTKWEYRVQTIGSFFGTKDELIQDTLDEWGEEGWEVINAYPAGNGEKLTLIAKRPLSSAARRQRGWPGS